MNHSYFLESDMSLMEAPERNLAFDLVRVTEAAALASARWLGRGDKNAGDGAAVDAMRLSFNSLPIAGKVVIGEGEKDEAPMLYNGEIIGMGHVSGEDSITVQFEVIGLKKLLLRYAKFSIL